MFVEKRKKKLKLEEKLEKIVVGLGLENCVMRLHKVGIYREKNLLISHLLVKVGFLDSNLLRTFGGPNEVRFGPTLARFKGLEGN